MRQLNPQLSKTQHFPLFQLSHSSAIITAT